MEQKLIKSRLRVRKHGEVFTPTWMVEKMLNVEGVKESCNTIEATFLEPAAGEGNFLMAILERKLDLVKKQYSPTLSHYENYALFALSTLYGIELLEDNAQMCVMNLMEVFTDDYRSVAETYNMKPKRKVLQSAKIIIRANIVQGNFLTRKTNSGQPIIFSEWKMTGDPSRKALPLKVIRSEYTLSEIATGATKSTGERMETGTPPEQLSFFSLDESEDHAFKEQGNLKYRTVKITDVYKEESEYVDG